MKREHAESVRICRLEVSKVAGEWKATTDRWHDQQRQCQQLANTIWQTWLVWHVQNGSADKLRAWLEQRKTEGVKAAGKCPVQAVPKELAKLIYRTCSEKFPHLHSRVRVLLQQRIVMGISSRKASSGSLPGWSAILLCNESIPSFTRGVPILFDIANTKLVMGDDGVPRVELKTTLIGKGKSVTDDITIWSKGSRVRSQVVIFKRVVAGTFKFCGSSLMFDRKCKKWFVMLSYRRPVHRATEVSPEKVAYLIPGRSVPFVFRERGVSRRWWMQQRGDHIGSMRRRVFGERRARSANYRLATARKGKGREHSNRWRDELSHTWSEFVRRVNHAVSHDAVAECVARGIGKLVYLKPSGSVADHRAVSTLGHVDGDCSTWEFFQLKTMLAYKCQDVGIEFSCVEFDGSSGARIDSAASGEAA
jgi:hypothetical protein